MLGGMRVRKLLHTRYRLNDLERSVKFYKEVLGLEEIRRHRSPRGSELVFLKAPESEELIELCCFPAGGPRPQRSAGDTIGASLRSKAGRRTAGGDRPYCTARSWTSNRPGSWLKNPAHCYQFFAGRSRTWEGDISYEADFLASLRLGD